MKVIVAAICPVCSRRIEVSESVARAGLKCPDCQTGFVPETTVTVEEYHAPIPAAAPVAPAWMTLQSRAEGTSTVAVWLLLAAGLVLFIGVVMQSDSLIGFLPFAIIAGSLAGVAFWLAVLAQLVHIRALLEKK